MRESKISNDNNVIIRVNDIVRCMYDGKRHTARVIDRKDIKTFLDDNYSILLCELEDSEKVWVNLKYCEKFEQNE